VVLASYEYRRYEIGQQPFWTPLRFPGQYYDAESNLFENWNRYYDAGTARYLQPDPLALIPWRWNGRDYDETTDRWTIKDLRGFGASRMNLYAYAASDPINRSDSTGLELDEKGNFYFKCDPSADQTIVAFEGCKDVECVCYVLDIQINKVGDCQKPGPLCSCIKGWMTEHCKPKPALPVVCTAGAPGAFWR
jgi:RHS repeat-associated protein